MEQRSQFKKMEKLKVSQSKVTTWQKCHRAYFHKYVEKIRPKRVRRPLKFGSIVHEMMEAYGQKKDPMKVLDEINLKDQKLFTAEREMYGEIIRDIRTIMSEYFDFWHPRDLKLVGVDGKYTEHHFEVEVAKDIIAEGYIDGLGITPNKLRWLVEHKTFDKLPSDDHRWRNLQSTLYIRIIEMLGLMKRVDGVCWNYIRSKPPTVPQLLKNGQLSVKAIVTLPSVVERTLKEHGLRSADHRKLIERAENSRKEYFFRIFTPVNHQVVDKMFDGFIDSAREIADNHGIKRDQNMGRHCDWCDYEPLCRAELTGGDVDFLKEKEYEKKPKRPEKGEKKHSKQKGESARRAPRKSMSAVSELRTVRKERKRKDNSRRNVSKTVSSARRSRSRN